MSVAGSLLLALDRAELIGCEAVQIFSQNQNQWSPRPPSAADLAAYRAAAPDRLIGPTVVHASYLLNLASPDDALWRRSVVALRAELDRSRAFGAVGVVLHPGAHVGSGEAAGLARVADGLAAVLRGAPADGPQILLETTAGQGTSLGHRFEYLARIIGLMDDPLRSRLGVCLDTCHVHAAGYDLRDGYEDTWGEFDQVIGLERIRVIHLNDSKKPFGSRVDRHAPLGEGTLGWAPFVRLVRDPRFADLPMLVETPHTDESGWAAELFTLRLRSA